MNEDVERIKDNLPSIDQMVNMTNVERKSSTEIQGEHPIHGSDTGMNMVLHTDTDTWHCFRCNTHSDRLGWIAVEEGLIDCKNADDISTVFTEVLELGAERAGIDIDLTPKEKTELRKNKEEWNKLQKGWKTAVQHFKDNLDEDIIKWINNKWGFDKEVIEKYDIGFAPGDKKLLPKLENEIGEKAYKTGMIIKTKNGMKEFFNGRVVIPYTNRGEYVYFIARKTPRTPDKKWDASKYKKLLTKSDKHSYVSEQVENELYGLNSIRGEKTIVITEGITDAISCMEMGYASLSPVTVQFSHDDIERVKKYVKNKDVYVCNDNDDAGLEGAIKTIEMIENSNMIQLPKEYNDLNDFYRENNKDDFDELVSKALPRSEALAQYHDDERYCFLPGLEEISQDPDKVRSEYDYENQEYIYYSLWYLLDEDMQFPDMLSIVRRSEKSHPKSFTSLNEKSRNRLVSASIIRHLTRTGKFIFDDDNDRVLYFDEEKHEVWDVEKQPFRTKLFKKYRVSEGSKESDVLLSDIWNYAKSYGCEVNVHQSWHFDKEEYILYIHNRDKYYYKLDGEDIIKKTNGEDGIFFQHRDEDNYIRYLEDDEREYPDKIIGQMDRWKDEGGFLHKVLCNRTNFQDKYALSAYEQRLQHLINIYIYPFDNNFSAKPISAWIGEKGSGKTLTMRWIGKFLMGDNFEVTTLPENKKDFTTVAHNLPIFFIDNMDKSKDWVNDILASVATGAKIQERELYTNMGLKEGRLNSWLAINSRDPKFKRDDIVDRLLIFYVERLEENIDPKLLTKTIIKNQDVLWSEYMDDLNKIISVWKKTDEGQIRSQHRIVSWVVFARIVTEALDLDKKKIDSLIDSMLMEKALFSLSDDPIVNALRKYRDECQEAKRWQPASKIDEKLREKSNEYDESYKSSHSLSKRLPHVHTELNSALGLEMKENRTKHRKEYKFEDNVFNDSKSDGSEDRPNLDNFEGDQESDLDDKKFGDTVNGEIMRTIDRLDDGDGASRMDIIESVDEYTEEEINNAINNLKTNGKIYEYGIDIFKVGV